MFESLEPSESLDMDLSPLLNLSFEKSFDLVVFLNRVVSLSLIYNLIFELAMNFSFNLGLKLQSFFWLSYSISFDDLSVLIFGLYK